jgi:RNA polymerase sigma factor (sigma-70 family)
MWDDDWAERVRALTPVVVRRVRSGQPGDADAEDACQAAWLALLRRPDALRDQDRLGAWLCTTARRHAARMFARRTREPLPAPEPVVSSPESHLLVAERDRALWRAVDSLPDRHRRLMNLIAYRPELTARQIAAELGISPGSLATLRSRCCARLRRRLIAEGFGESEPR